MQLHLLLKSGGLTALALAIAAPLYTAPALAQDTDASGAINAGRNEGAAQRRSERRAERQAERQVNRTERREAQQGWRAPQQAQPAPQAPPPQAQQVGGSESRWGRRDEEAPARWNGEARERPTMGERRREPGSEQPQGTYTPPAQTSRDRQRDRVADNDGRDWNRDGQRDWNRDGQRDWNRDGNWRDNDRDYRDNDRNRDYRDHDRNGSYRDGYRDARQDYRRDYRRWDRRWRDDRRYDWNRYRYSNRDHYRLGRYYAPYRHYSYRRLSIGFYLDSLFFGNRYWISDPWSYRLPQVYGPYRWVRYYDDVLLVDIYSGEVVDVIYDFFW